MRRGICWCLWGVGTRRCRGGCIAAVVVVCTHIISGASCIRGEYNEHRRSVPDLQLRRYARLVVIVFVASPPRHTVVSSCDLGATDIDAFLYLGVVQPAPEGASFGSLQGVMLLFQSPTAVLGGWIHYLIFDLFIGAWIVRDAKRRDINHWLTLPILFATLMVGPVGLMLYLLLRFAMKGTVTLAETSA